MPPTADTDGLLALAEGLSGYLAEISTLRAICLRHESSATVRAAMGVLHVQRLFDPKSGVADRLAAHVNALPGWEQSLFWPSEQARWERLRARTAARWKADPRAGRVALRGVTWHGRPLLVSGCSQGAGAPIQVVTSLPGLPLDLPELPLRQVAEALHCHEFLLPTSVAVPLPVGKHVGDWGHLRQYLERAAPQNRYASQCFSQPRAERWRPPLA
jgi:hypothetical protein